MPTVTWKKEPDDHDYPAAASYLSLIVPDDQLDHLIKKLKGADIVLHKAKDLLRAARLPLLPTDNAHVASDLAKIADGTALSPVLLVRGDITKDLPVQIADGYHRVCASYHTDENTDIPARIIDLE